MYSPVGKVSVGTHDHDVRTSVVNSAQRVFPHAVEFFKSEISPYIRRFFPRNGAELFQCSPIESAGPPQDSVGHPIGFGAGRDVAKLRSLQPNAVDGSRSVRARHRDAKNRNQDAAITAAMRSVASVASSPCALSLKT